MSATDRRHQAMQAVPLEDTALAEVVAEQKEAARGLEARAEEAVRISRRLEDLRLDVARLEARHKALSELGDERITVPLSSYDQKWQMQIEWRPLESLKTGRQLATEVEATLEQLRAAIAADEAEIARLLGEEEERPKAKAARRAFLRKGAPKRESV